MEERRGAYRVLVGKPKAERSRGRPRLGWKDDVKIDITEISWEGMYWIDLAQDMDKWQAVVNTVMNV
jgi:hypothetical protein